MILAKSTGKLIIAGFAALLLSLVGCSSSKSRVGGAFNLDTDLKLSFLADANINPDHNTRSSPVIVRLYELSTDSGFAKADFIDIYERDEKVLGRTLLGKRVFNPIVPGEQRDEVLVLSPGTTHVALYAEFSQYQGADYKVVFPVTQNNVFRNSAKIRIVENRLSMVD
ncbi:type VI secretion system lipoprotein TssJ [Gilvimarinus sp. F26214L]|uniref:type VI secretion system lipoprotein TssJ n=1 Tax=Gilvimarinus sp. DZF01 TaxID=3461371 RepID=UPI0040455390